MNRSGTNLKYSIKERLYDVKEMIDNHVENVHTSVTENVKQTIKYVQKKQKTSQRMMKPQSKRHHTPKLDPSLNAVRRLWDQVASGETPSSEFEVTLSYKNKRPKLEKKSSTSESPRLTKGEQVDSKSDKEVILVDTKLDRLRRQGKKVNSTRSLLFCTSLPHARAYYTPSTLLGAFQLYIFFSIALFDAPCTICNK